MSENIGDTNGYLSVRKEEPRAPFRLLSPSSAGSSSSPGGVAAATGSGVRPRPKIAHIIPTPQIEHGCLSSPAPGNTRF